MKLKKYILTALLILTNILVHGDEIGWVTDIQFKADTALVITNEGFYKMWLVDSEIRYEKYKNSLIAEPKDMVVDENNNVWVASEHGVFMEVNGLWQQLSSKHAWQIVVNKGVVYFESYAENGNDLNYYKIENGKDVLITTFSAPVEYSSHRPFSFNIHDEKLFVGTNYRLPFIYDNGKWMKYNNKRCWGFLYAKNELIMKGDRELVFDDRAIPYPKYPTCNLYIDQRNTIYLFDKEHIYKLLNNEWIEVFSPTDGNYVFAVKDDEYWVGSFMKVKVYKGGETYEVKDFGTKSYGCHEPEFIDTPFGEIYLEEMQSGVIQDEDGYTNVRENPTTSSKIICTIKENENFLYYEISDSNWWYIYKDDEKKGYMHKSRIKKN